MTNRQKAILAILALCLVLVLVVLALKYVETIEDANFAGRLTVLCLVQGLDDAQGCLDWAESLAVYEPIQQCRDYESDTALYGCLINAGVIR
jgi:hypothetical protein